LNSVLSKTTESTTAPALRGKVFHKMKEDKTIISPGKCPVIGLEAPSYYRFSWVGLPEAFSYHFS
jgi:hypothetical protein